MGFKNSPHDFNMKPGQGPLDGGARRQQQSEDWRIGLRRSLKIPKAKPDIVYALKNFAIVVSPKTICSFPYKAISEDTDGRAGNKQSWSVRANQGQAARISAPGQARPQAGLAPEGWEPLCSLDAPTTHVLKNHHTRIFQASFNHIIL